MSPGSPSPVLESEAAEPTALFAARVEPNLHRLPSEFYTVMTPERVGTEPRLVHANARAGALIDLDSAAFGTPAFTRIFSGHARVGGFDPLATVYSGHQFGTYVPRLGDGRALLIAQVRNREGEL